MHRTYYSYIKYELNTLKVNKHIVLYNGIQFPTCFGLSKPPSGRIKYNGRKTYVNKNIDHHRQISETRVYRILLQAISTLYHFNIRNWFLYRPIHHYQKLDERDIEPLIFIRITFTDSKFAFAPFAFKHLHMIVFDPNMELVLKNSSNCKIS